MFNFTKLYLEYKQYIEENSKYGAKVVKDLSETSTYFPIIDFKHQDDINTGDATHGGIEYYDREYFVINIYTQDKGNISRNVISQELKELTHKFLGRYKGMERTSCQPMPNIDASIERVIMKYQCQYGNIYGNIIRR